MSEVTNKGGALRKVGRATAWVGKKWVWTVTADSTLTRTPIPRASGQ